MVHNKPIDASLVQEMTRKFLDDLTHASYPELKDPDAVDAATRALIEIRVISSVAAHLRESLQPIVDRARAAGATWEQIAEAAYLKTPSSAYSNWGRGYEERTELQRKRAAETRRSGPKPPPPGVTAVEAAEHFGIDRRTVKSRAEKGEIRTVTVKSASGRDRVRYILD